MGSHHLENDLLEDNQPFPTLQLAMETLDPHLGFNLEIKWTMQLQVCMRFSTLDELLAIVVVGVVSLLSLLSF